MALNPSLEIQDLSFRYLARPVLNAWSEHLEAGIVWIQGENGAGKTTLLKLLAGALDFTEGSIRLNELDICKNALAYRQQTFWCSGEVPLFPWLSGQELVNLYRSLYRDISQELLHAHLETFMLFPVLHQPLPTLSLGQYKKLQLALALSAPVTLLLMDEPCNGLDEAALAYLQQQLAAPDRLSRQIVLLTSHIAPILPVHKTVRVRG